jgi:microcystin-dependent protein
MKNPPSGRDGSIPHAMEHAKARSRRAFTKGLAFGLIPLVAFGVLAGGLQRGQAEDALFIDQEGTVKVKRLDVERTISSQDLKTTGTVDAKKYVGDGSDLTVKTEKGEQTLQEVMALIKQAMDKMVPIGTIMAYGGDVRNAEVAKQLESQGWLVCNGMQVKRDDYPALFKAVGVSFGAGDGKATFHLPDLRGRFPRGVDLEDPNRANWRDPDHDTRRPSAGGGNTGNRVGSVQEDALQGHRHETNAINNASSKDAIAGINRRTSNRNPASVGKVIKDDPYGEARVSKETRPKNVYVNWIIKARHAM